MSENVKSKAISKMKRTTGEYNSWVSAKARCYNPKNNRYHIYGARGIGMCERWRNSFANFIIDMGQKPTPKHSIERIDNNGNYEPGNCKWATAKEQARNRKAARWIEINGSKHCAKEACEILGLKYRTFTHRVWRGQSTEQAFRLTPQLNTPIKYNGQSKSLREWSTKCGIKYSTLRLRILKGWPISRALQQSVRVMKGVNA